MANIQSKLCTEANKCIGCKKARCTIACPVNTQIPECIKLYNEGNYIEAGRILFENNPFSLITSRVCNYKALCYGHCVLNIKQTPVKWYEIEQFISLEYITNFHPKPYPITQKSVGIIGGGPAGITAAIKLREYGYKVTIYDSKPYIGGVLKYGIPHFRLNPNLINEYHRLIKEYDIELKTNVSVGKDISIEELRTHHNAILIATGASIPRKLKVNGEKDNNKIIYALNYLDNPTKYKLGKNVIVIGGGNVTMDASRTAIRQGSKVTVYYRKSFENMPANAIEIEEAKQDGVQFVLFEVPIEIIDGNKAVMRKCQNIQKEDGTIVTKMLEGQDHIVEFDNMIVAISGNVDYSIFGANMPKLNDNGWLYTTPYHQTSFKDIFIAGDFLLGPQTVVEAVATAKKAAEGIVKYLDNV